MILSEGNRRADYKFNFTINLTYLDCRRLNFAGRFPSCSHWDYIGSHLMIKVVFKFRIVVLGTMGYLPHSEDMKSVALLWQF